MTLFEFFNLFRRRYHLLLHEGHFWHPEASTFLEALAQRGWVDLVSGRWMVPALSINVMRQQIVSVVHASTGWFCVRPAVGMEGWLSKVSSERGVWQPPRCVVEFRPLLFKLLA